MIRLTFILVVVLGLAGTDAARARPSDDVQTAIEEGRLLIEQAHAGSPTAAADARKVFERVLATEPSHALARAHLGLARVLEARDAPLARKRSLAQEGFAEIDAAVHADPGAIEVRLLRAINASQMPLLLGRRAVAEADFAWLLRAAAAPLGAESPSIAERRRIFFHAGAFGLKERRREAITLLEAALSLNAPEPGDEQVQSMLALARREFNPAEHAHGEENQSQAAPP